MTWTPRRTELVLRPAEERDVEAIRRVAREAWETAARRVLGAADRQELVGHLYERRTLLEDIGRHSSLFLVATCEGAVVGFGEFVFEGSAGEVARVAVRPDWQRRGVASALLRRGLAAFAEAGMEVVTAAVEPEDQACRLLFEHLGFEPATEASGEPAEQFTAQAPEDLQDLDLELSEYRRRLDDRVRLTESAAEATVWVDDRRRTCPRCHRHFDKPVDACPDCRVTLVAEAPRRREGGAAKESRFVTVTCTSDESRLSFVQSALESAGIVFALHRRSNGSGEAEVVEVQVARSQAEDAREVLDALEEEPVEAAADE